MRCAICSELFHAPVTLLPCLHNFCSLCVRNHFKTTYTGMKRKANCPQCHEPVKVSGSSDYEKGILPNKFLEQQVDIYKLCRDPLRERLVRLDVLEKEKKFGVLGVSSHGRKRAKATSERRGTRSRSSKRARNEVAKMADYSSASSEESDIENEEDYDDCDDENKSKISSMSSSHQPHKAYQKLKRKPTMTYHKLNHKKLMQLCKNEGLSNLGTDEELKQRHSSFITLYNSECDSDHPRSVKDLVKDMKSRESSIKREASDTNARKQSKFVKNLDKSLSSDGRPTSGNEKFDATLSSNFANMIADVSRRKQGMGNQVKQAAKSPDGRHCDATLSTEIQGNDVQERGSDGGHCESASMNPEARREIYQRTDTPSPQQQLAAGNLEPRCIDTNDAASIHSDKTMLGQNKNIKQNSSTPSESTVAAIPKHHNPSSVKKSKLKSNCSTSGTMSHSRVSNLGAWVCTTCTFENLRNVSRKARCEMCAAVRPIMEVESLEGHHRELAKEVEIVNIDC